MEIQNNVSQILESMQSVIDNISMSLLLGILGIAITIFTVIYSFMETAKQRKRELSDRTALLTETDPVLQSDLSPDFTCVLISEAIARFNSL